MVSKDGRRICAFPYSAWELIEHLRITQRDILDFCQAAVYRGMRWPQHYWPSSPTPPTSNAWAQSVASFQSDRNALKQIALHPKLDLTAAVPHGSDQTYLRELLLVADHNAYHVGQLILVRRALGAARINAFCRFGVPNRSTTAIAALGSQSTPT